MEGIINIAGVMPRIGTTTAALQLTAFLGRFGYKAAYLEANKQDYIWSCQSMYESFKKDKEEDGKAVCEGIDLYQASWMEQLTEGGTHYDYLVCDHGNITSPDFDRKAFLNCSATVLVGGMKANEVFQTEDALREEDYNKSIWLYNFIRKEDEKEILTLMGEKAKFTSFLPYMPDPFLTENDTKEIDGYFKRTMSAIKYRIDRRK